MTFFWFAPPCYLPSPPWPTPALLPPLTTAHTPADTARTRAHRLPTPPAPAPASRPTGSFCLPFLYYHAHNTTPCAHHWFGRSDHLPLSVPLVLPGALRGARARTTTPTADSKTCGTDSGTCLAATTRHHLPYLRNAHLALLYGTVRLPVRRAFACPLHHPPQHRASRTCCRTLWRVDGSLLFHSVDASHSPSDDD